MSRLSELLQTNRRKQSPDRQGETAEFWQKGTDFIRREHPERLIVSGLSLAEIDQFCKRFRARRQTEIAARRLLDRTNIEPSKQRSAQSIHRLSNHEEGTKGKLYLLDSSGGRRPQRWWADEVLVNQRDQQSPWTDTAPDGQKAEFKRFSIAVIDLCNRIQANTAVGATATRTRRKPSPNASTNCVVEVQPIGLDGLYEIVIQTRNLLDSNATASPGSQRKRSEPTGAQIDAAEAMVRSQSDVNTRIASQFLRCTPQHVYRLVRQRKLTGSKTKPMRITSASLRAYTWPNESGSTS
jgi:hypothetical protein